MSARAALLIAGVLLAAVWGRAWFGARAELAQAQLAEQAGDLETAVLRYQFAMRWYTPLAGAPRDAADALWRLGQASDTPAQALPPLRRLRGGVLATRWLMSPFGDRLDATNQRIAKLMAVEQLALGHPTIRGRDQAQLEADHLALLRLDPMPSPGWSLLVVLTFIGWIGGGFLTIFRGFDRELKRQPPFPRWAALTVACFGLWLLGLWQA